MAKTKSDFFGKYKTYDTSEGFGSAKEWKRTFNERMTGKDTVQEKMQQTPYDILGISPGATQAEIKAAYRSMMKQWHPDKNIGREAECNEMAKKLNAAYQKIYIGK